MFTHMASRSVHIKMANTLNRLPLNAFGRFVGRQGPVGTLSCDRGTSFVRDKKNSTEMDTDYITRELVKNNSDWVEIKMNVSFVSHMDDAWDRMIRSAERQSLW